jgi:hypothetical protein
MKIRLYALIVFLLFSATGCYATITGSVVDAETGEPIEGAVVLVEWTKTKGLPGMTHTESYKVIEAVTDKEGNVTISGVFNPTVNPPQVTVYKKGYVAWNSRVIFPDYKRREGFKWVNGYIFRLERFKSEYTHEAHVSFLLHSYSFGLGANSKFEKAWNWEILISEKEAKKKGK